MQQASVCGKLLPRQLARSGIVFEQGQDPAGGNVVDDEGQFGESSRQEIRELIDRPRVLPRLRFKPAGDLAEQVLPGGKAAGQVEPATKVNATAMASGDGFEAFAQLLVADGGLNELEVGRGGLQIGAQEAGMMAEP